MTGLKQTGVYMIYNVVWNTLLVSKCIPARYSGEEFKRVYGHLPLYQAQIPLAGQTFNLQKELARVIVESKDDSFVFVLTRRFDQYRNFNAWIKLFNLEEYIVLDFKPGITNPNYISIADYSEATVGNLQLAVLASKDHPQRNEFILMEPKLGVSK